MQDEEISLFLGMFVMEVSLLVVESFAMVESFVTGVIFVVDVSLAKVESFAIVLSFAMVVSFVCVLSLDDVIEFVSLYDELEMSF